MSGMWQHFRLTLRLHFRNRMALFYGYLFPVVFLVAFWVLYRYDQVPLIRHLGALLTISVLGGACFGLPTTLVSERERGVWRRYRLSPLSIGGFVTSTVLARYVLVVTAGLLQLVLAVGLGMPWPAHLAELLVAFTFVAFAFLGLGLVMATLADNVPAVQALGQCIFLPMLIIGGVAVPLTALPGWAQHVSAFFPGRYAVEAIQATTTGGGLGEAGFALFALVLIGAAGCLAGAKMFRWDVQQGRRVSGHKLWVVLALAAWLAVGLLAESSGRIAVVGFSPDTEQTPAAPAEEPPPPEMPLPEPAEPEPEPVVTPPVDGPAEPVPPPTPEPPASEPEVPAETTAVASSWQQITPANIQAIRRFRVPPDEGVVAPIAADDRYLDGRVAWVLDQIEANLPNWGPAQVADPVQRVRNILYVAAVPDVIQSPVESYAPWVVFDALEAAFPRDDLIKILAWIALHPEDGGDSAVARVTELGIEGTSAPDLARERAYYYAIKAINRLHE